MWIETYCKPEKFLGHMLMALCCLLLSTPSNSLPKARALKADHRVGKHLVFINEKWPVLMLAELTERSFMSVDNNEDHGICWPCKPYKYFRRKIKLNRRLCVGNQQHAPPCTAFHLIHPGWSVYVTLACEPQSSRVQIDTPLWLQFRNPKVKIPTVKAFSARRRWGPPVSRQQLFPCISKRSETR